MKWTHKPEISLLKIIMCNTIGYQFCLKHKDFRVN